LDTSRERTFGSNTVGRTGNTTGLHDRLAGLAAELVALDVDVIVAGVTQASLAAKAATRTIPIVMVAVADPVGTGLVASLSRPGGNVTGTSTVSAEVVGKQLELLKEVTPNVDRVAVLWNPANSVFQALQVREAQAAGRRTGLELRFLEATAPSEFGAVFAAMQREGMRTLLVLADPVFRAHHDALLELIATNRVIAASGFRDFAAAGGLLAYGPSYDHASKRAAVYVDKILKGAKPGDLPVEQPTSFELVLNLKVAQALNLSIPSSVLIRADEVIE
jgi:putative tryptophan/tyrosine transport system substrate-binding protein